jgi:signal transduction histidine kinase
MFQKARLKLTVWYVLIILLITGTLSLIAYNRVASVMDVQFQRMQAQINRDIQRRYPGEVRIRPEQENLREGKKQVATQLILINAGIGVITAAASYFLSGKTLKPIQTTLDEHKRFISDAAHELRTPITSLKTAIEVSLMDQKIDADTQDLLKDNLREIKNLEHLTNSLLHLARQEQTNSKPECEQIQLDQVILDVVKQLSPLAKKKQIKLISSCKPEEIKMEGYQDGIAEMTRIFLDNAIKYTPKKGTVEITAVSHRGRITITISDTGVGIDRPHVPYIFDRFYRVDTARTKKDMGGYGLGLSIAKKIIDQHNGQVKVDSKKGQGATFTVTMGARLS